MTPVIELVLALIAVALAAWVINRQIRMPENLKLVSNIVLALIVVGIALWLINNYIPMAGSILAILNIVVVLATCVAVLKAFGLWSPIVAMWNDFLHRSRTHDDRPSPLITNR